jgi:hypothetical protein
MQHPLVNPSLAPFGFVFPRYRDRLNFESPHDPHWVNPERAMAQFWQKLHRHGADSSFPIEEIVHNVLPSMNSRCRITDGDFTFRGKPYLSRDIALISTIMYWFGTNIGNCFLLYPHGLHTPKRHDHEFLEKFNLYMKEQRNLVAMWTHVCNNDCKLSSMPFADPHRDRPKEVTPRDYAVAEALMRWLGASSGRVFIASWAAHISKLQLTARDNRFKMLPKVA